VILRRVEAGDGPRWRGLRLAMLADTPVAYAELLADALGTDDAAWEQGVRRAAAGTEVASFVLQEGDAWVGCAAGYAPRGAHPPAGSTVLASVFLAPGHRGVGLLDRLVGAVAAWSLDAGRDRLWLQVARENPRAVAAYARLGFVPNGRSEPHPLFPAVTELEMERQLTGR